MIKNNNLKKIFGLISIILVITMISGCTSDSDTSNNTNTSEPAKSDKWAQEYPLLTDKCPVCGSKSKLDEKSDTMLIYYCKNCDAYYGVNTQGDDKRIGWDSQDGVSEMKYFPSS